jgi:oxygen-independent coproporphyrinogen-3 oxidase
LAALNREILQSPFRGSDAVTLYFGGGTPSELRVAEMKTVLMALSQTVHFVPGAEWTIECNPNSVKGSFLAAAKENGFNRVSLGIQSFQQKNLDWLGRAHKTRDSFLTYQSARDCGFEQVSIDLIFGIPNQTLLDWKEDLECAIDLQPDHLSIYCLTIEPGTELGRAVHRGQLKPINTDLSGDMFELAMALTSQAGYEHYEISNYSLKGSECRHNIRYWRNEPYLGFGLGAASFNDGVRWTNTSDWELYETTALTGHVARSTEEKLGKRDAFAEEIMLRLRTRWGFSPDKLSLKYGYPFWDIMGRTAESFLELGLLEYFEDCLRLTRKGILLADEVCGTFLIHARR